MTTIANNIFYGNLGEGGDSVEFDNGATGTISYCDAYNPGQPDAVEYYDEENLVTPDSTCQYVNPQFSGPPLIPSAGFEPSRSRLD